MANFIRDRNKPRVNRDRSGTTTTQHWDGRRDVNVQAKPVILKASVQKQEQ